MITHRKSAFVRAWHAMPLLACLTMPLHAQVVVQPPGIRVVLAGPGITVNTNGFTRTISAPGAAGDITGGAVTGGLLTVSESAGILTYGLTTNTVRAAVSGLYLPVATTITLPDSESIRFDNGIGISRLFMDSGGVLSIGGDYFTGVLWHSGNDGAASELDAGFLGGEPPSYYLNLANATNTLPRARLPTSQTTPVVSWASSDCTFHTTDGVWWYPYENTSIDLGAFGLRAAAADDQTGTLRTKWTPVPPEAQAFAESAAITLTFAVSATTGVTECRGLRLMGRTGIGAPVTLYSDATTRDGHASVAGGLVSFEIARSSFTSTNMVDRIQAEVDVSVEDTEVFALDGVKVGFQ